MLFLLLGLRRLLLLSSSSLFVLPIVVGVFGSFSSMLPALSCRELIFDGHIGTRTVT
jgi:hypothetical protein